MSADDFGPHASGPPRGASDVARISDQLEAMNHMFQRRLLADREQRKALDLLQTQLSWARDQAEGQAVRPLAFRLMLLLDRLEARLSDGASTTWQYGSSADDAFLRSVADELLTCLAAHGVERIPWQSAPFDAVTQEAVGVTPTGHGDRHGHAHALVRHGYRLGTSLLRPQAVWVFGGAPGNADPP